MVATLERGNHQCMSHDALSTFNASSSLFTVYGHELSTRIKRTTCNSSLSTHFISSLPSTQLTLAAPALP